MQGLKTRKYMDIFTNIGYAIGFLMIILTSLFQWSYVYILAGVIIIFIGRCVGYGIDRIVEMKEEKNK